MTTTITTAARRIAREVNDTHESEDVVFALDGTPLDTLMTGAHRLTDDGPTGDDAYYGQQTLRARGRRDGLDGSMSQAYAQQLLDLAQRGAL